jgi:hypothetical protein
MKRTLKRESKVLEIAGIEGMSSSVGPGDFTAGGARRPSGGIAQASRRACLARARVLSPGLWSGWVPGRAKTAGERWRSGRPLRA